MSRASVCDEGPGVGRARHFGTLCVSDGRHLPMQRLQLGVAPGASDSGLLWCGCVPKPDDGAESDPRS